ncbi:MAG: hypothetical protein GY783_09405 [Gammaproteobacteria bacterium]|nr:hypothetical protein [Gammaproteobacteria bacterium]
MRITMTILLGLLLSACGQQSSEHQGAIVIADLNAAGFELEAQIDMLRNPDDDYSKIVFDPDLRGKTDRFVMRYRKPE